MRALEKIVHQEIERSLPHPRFFILHSERSVGWESFPTESSIFYASIPTIQSMEPPQRNPLPLSTAMVLEDSEPKTSSKGTEFFKKLTPQISSCPEQDYLLGLRGVLVVQVRNHLYHRPAKWVFRSRDRSPPPKMV